MHTCHILIWSSRLALTLALLLLCMHAPRVSSSTQTLRQQAQAVLSKVDSLLVWGPSMAQGSAATSSTGAFLPSIFTHLQGPQYVHSSLCIEAQTVQSKLCQNGGHEHITSCIPHILVVEGHISHRSAQAEHACILKHEQVILQYLNSPQCKGVLAMQTQDHSNDPTRKGHGSTLHIQHPKIRYLPAGISAQHAAELHNNLHNHPIESCTRTASGIGAYMLPTTETLGSAQQLDVYYKKISCSMFVDCRTGTAAGTQTASASAAASSGGTNDWDSTRVWETLALGSIPVLARVAPGQGAHMLDGLPVYWVEPGEVVTAKSLQQAYTELVSTGTKYHYKRITLHWWLDKVKSMAEGIPIPTTSAGGTAGHRISGMAGEKAAPHEEAKAHKEAAAYRASPKCSHPRATFAFKKQYINPTTNCTVGWRNPQGLHAGQNLEDAVVLERFFGRGSPLYSGKDEWKRGGTFLEIGGLDGITFSNTLLLEQCLGWQGVLVEAQPANAQLMFQNRPCAFNYAEGVCQPAGLIYMSKEKGVSHDLSTRVNAASISGGVNKLLYDSVPCRPLSDIVLDAGLRRINVMFVDVEGAEFKVLQTFDFSVVQVDVLIVETTMVFSTNTLNLRQVGIEGKVNNVRSLLKSKGFFRLSSRLDQGKTNSNRCMRLNKHGKKEKINCMFLSIAGSDVFVRSMEVFDYDGGEANEDSF